MIASAVTVISFIAEIGLAVLGFRLLFGFPFLLGFSLHFDFRFGGLNGIFFTGLVKRLFQGIHEVVKFFVGSVHDIIG